MYSRSPFFVIVIVVFFMCNGSVLGRQYRNDCTNINRAFFKNDTTSIDSVFYAHLNVSYGAYHNLIMGRYFAENNYKGVKSILDVGIPLCDIYSKNIPIVFINHKSHSILLFDYSTILSKISQIESVRLIKNNTNIANQEKLISAKNADTLFIYVNKHELNHNINIKFSDAINSKVEELPQYNDYSPIDSILMKVLGYNLNQFYNKCLSDNYIYQYSPFHMFSVNETTKNITPTSMKNIVGDIFFSSGRFVDVEKNRFGVKIFIDGLPLNFYHKMRFRSVEMILPLDYSLKIEKSYAPWFDYIRVINIYTK